MKQLPREVPTQPFPKGIDPKPPKRPEEGWIRVILIVGTLLILYIVSQYIK